jgi:hypothetical protein
VSRLVLPVPLNAAKPKIGGELVIINRSAVGMRLNFKILLPAMVRDACLEKKWYAYTF